MPPRTSTSTHRSHNLCQLLCSDALRNKIFIGAKYPPVGIVDTVKHLYMHLSMMYHNFKIDDLIPIARNWYQYHTLMNNYLLLKNLWRKVLNHRIYNYKLEQGCNVTYNRKAKARFLPKIREPWTSPFPNNPLKYSRMTDYVLSFLIYS